MWLIMVIVRILIDDLHKELVEEGRIEGECSEGCIKVDKVMKVIGKRIKEAQRG